MDASGTTLADMTVSVSFSDPCAYVECGETLISATGFSMSSPLPTTQSSAFFKAPGTRRVLGARDDDGVTRLQRGSECRHRRRRALAVVIRIERRQAGEPVVD